MQKDENFAIYIEKSKKLSKNASKENDYEAQKSIENVEIDGENL